jgi:hypothetical protein
MASEMDDIEAAAARARAQVDADAIVARAEVDATAVRARAEADAQAILADAQRQAERVLAEADATRAQAEVAATAAQDDLRRARTRSREVLGEAAEIRRSADASLAHLLEARAALDAVLSTLGDRGDGLLDLTDASDDPAGDRAEGADVDPGSGADDDPVTRMVRSALGRASRAATEQSTWREGPAQQRAAMRATGRSLR